jgi:hypothetical protein
MYPSIWTVDQCIADALACTDAPRPIRTAALRTPNESLFLGTVPEHLRNLFNLVEDTGEGAHSEIGRGSDAAAFNAQCVHKKVRAHFLDLLDQYVPLPARCLGLVIDSDWRVYGTVSPH